MGCLIPLALPSTFLIFYLLYFRRFRSYASYRGLVKFFAFGAIMAIPVVIVESIFTIPLMANEVTNSLLQNSMSGDVRITEDQFLPTAIFVIYMSFVVAAITEGTCGNFIL